MRCSTGLLWLLLVSHATAAPPGLPSQYPLHALTHAKVYVSPDNVLEDATVIIENGKIRQVGIGLVPPAGARIWDCQGKVIHAGFVDPFLGESDPKEEKPSPSGLGDTVDEDFRSAGSASDGPSKDLPEAVQAQRRVEEGFRFPEARLDKLRALGVLTVQVVPQKGIFRGQGALLAVRAQDPLLKIATSQVIGLRTQDSGAKENDYPASFMGNLSLLRQVFREVDWAAQNPQTLQIPRLASWTALRQARSDGRPFFFEGRSLMEGVSLRRALLPLATVPWIWVTTPDVALQPDWLQGKLVLTLEAPKLELHQAKRPEVSHRQLAVWRSMWALPAQLARKQVPFSLSLHGLKDWDQYPGSLQQLRQAGLSEAHLLESLTRRPASWLGVGQQLGTLEKGKWATLVVRQGSEIFSPDAKVEQVWVQGIPTRLAGSEKFKSRVKPEGPEYQPPPGWAGPASVLIRNATVWTQSPQGVLEGCDVRVEAGRIVALGKGLSAGNAQQVDGTGKHLIPGLIDAHSHTAIVGDVNEMTSTTTAQVDIRDVIDPTDNNIQMQLTGGVTCAHVLHGSANAIGGRTLTLKWRWGGDAQQLIFQQAPPGIKFALGENPKQSNWGDKFTTRYPQTRQGVAALIRQRFLEARKYRELTAPSPDEGLEALLEVLDGKRLVHCHSYRQDEILMLLKLAEELGFRVATLQHGLEAYKVADEVARHGAGVSSFSDWWAYKPEVMDAIPYNGALLHQRGVNVSFNSDSDELARRLLGEASKAVRYGGLSEAEALNFITLNPARQLGIDKQVGSLEVGKDGDFSLWSGSPFDPQSRCLQTWVEGRSLFEVQAYREQQQRLRAQRQAWLEQALKQEAKP